MNWHKFLWIALAVAFGLLQVALIVAKLLGHIHWSWWLVMTPLWSPMLCVFVLAIVAIALLADSASHGGNPFQ